MSAPLLSTTGRNVRPRLAANTCQSGNVEVSIEVPSISGTGLREQDDGTRVESLQKDREAIGSRAVLESKFAFQATADKIIGALDAILVDGNLQFKDIPDWMWKVKVQGTFPILAVMQTALQQAETWSTAEPKHRKVR